MERQGLRSLQPVGSPEAVGIGLCAIPRAARREPRPPDRGVGVPAEAGLQHSIMRVQARSASEDNHSLTVVALFEGSLNWNESEIVLDYRYRDNENSRRIT